MVQSLLPFGREVGETDCEVTILSALRWGDKVKVLAVYDSTSRQATAQLGKTGRVLVFVYS